MSHRKSARAVRRRARTTTLTVLLQLLMLIALAPSARATNAEVIDQTFPASVTPAGLFADAGSGENPSISADGRYVAFASSAQNLGEHGPIGVSEAYVKDLQTGDVKLVSRANGIDGEPANEPGEASGVERVIISGDGRYVIFTSDATNLRAGEPTPQPEEHPWHVYRRELQTGETVLIDRVTGIDGAVLGEREPRGEAISSDGRYVVFSDEVQDLEDPAGEHEWTAQTVYVRDVQSATSTAVSRASGAEGAIADSRSIARSITPDGRYVAFESAATNLVPGMQANAVFQVYLRDLQAHTTTLVSRGAPSEAAPAGEAADESAEEAILVGEDGCRVAFESAASNLYSYEPTPPGSPEVYVSDVCSTPATTTLVSRADGADGESGEGGEVIPLPLGASADGRYVLFQAVLDNAGKGPLATQHLYLRDLSSERTTLLDRAGGAGGEVANGAPEQGAISANGCRVAFATRATNLIEASGPSSSQPSQTYVRQLSSCLPASAAQGESKPPSAGGTEAQQPSGQPGGAPQGSAPLLSAPASHTATRQPRLRIERLRGRRLVLELSGPGRIEIVIARELVRERRRSWQAIRTIALTASAAGQLVVSLPRLGPGRYRVDVGVAGGKPVARMLSVRRRD